MPLARASELDRLFACHGSAILPREDQKPGYIKPMSASRAAMWGTLCHKWKETGVLPDNIAWAKPLDKKIKASRIDRLVTWPQDGEHEVALAYNVLTGRAARCRPPTGAAEDYKDNWKAGFDDEWVVGTLDYTRELLGTPWVDDLKTGRVVSFHDYEYQQAFYCLAWGVATYERVAETRTTLTHWPHYPLEAGPRRFGSVFDVEYLQDFGKKLKKLRDQVLRARGDSTKLKLVVGSQCTYCPSKSACPRMGEEVD